MARSTVGYDASTLEMALVGYQIERQKIDERIRAIQAQLRGKAGATPAAAPKRVLSAAARRRIALAQKKRWAEHRRRLAHAAKK